MFDRRDILKMTTILGAAIVAPFGGAKAAESKLSWRFEALRPDVVIPGHFSSGTVLDIETVRFTASYIRAYDEEAARAKNSAELIAAMKARYPNLGGLSSLELSAKVSKGEMEWH